MTTRILTGITPTGTPHLGNYAGAIRPAILASRRSDVDSFYFLADYHALIKCDDPARIQRSRLEIAATWLAGGLDVARDHGMSIRNFMRRFQAATGDKPLHYLQRLRIETAKGMLSSTRKSIKTISYEVGYDDASFFARLFRQHTELSPHHYRRQFMQKES